MEEETVRLERGQDDPANSQNHSTPLQARDSFFQKEHCQGNGDNGQSRSYRSDQDGVPLGQTIVYQSNRAGFDNAHERDDHLRLPCGARQTKLASSDPGE